MTHPRHSPPSKEILLGPQFNVELPERSVVPSEALRPRSFRQFFFEASKDVLLKPDQGRIFRSGHELVTLEVILGC